MNHSCARSTIDNSMHLRIATLLSLIVVATSACSSGVKVVSELPRITPGRPLPGGLRAGDARVEIVSPTSGTSVQRDAVAVEVEVSNFDLAVGDPSQPQPGVGHLVYYAGADYTVPFAPGRPANAGGRGSFVSFVTTKTSYTWRSMDPGRQIFAVQLVSSDNLPIDPPQIDSVIVEIRG